MFRQKFFLTVFTIYQLFSTALIAINVWPGQMVYVNLIIQLAALFLFDLEYALYSVILTIPFYLAVPNSKFDSLSAWRFTFAGLFLVFWYKFRQAKQKINFFSWDRPLVWLCGAIILSILFEPFKTVGIKKLIFVGEVYALYVVAINVINTKEKILRAITASFVSLATIVLIGYIQFAATFTTSTYYFWQYWAELISKNYYGQTLAYTLTYSNSWFSFYKNAPPSLRMFSILPDSHAFAVIAMFSIPYAATLLYFAKEKWKKILLWIFIAMASLAITLSGTRGVWAGAIAPIIILICLYAKHWGRKLTAPMFIPIILFIVFLVSSPLVQKVVSSVDHASNYGNFVQRASSIYDLNDSSNAGRIAIWKNTLKFAAAHPLFGAGFGNFVITLSSNNQTSISYQQLAAQNVQTYNLPKQYITAHDIYLDFLAETGIIGLIFFIWYLIKIFKKFWDFFKKHYLFAEDGYVFFVTNIGLYLVWLFAYLFVDGTLINDRVLMYFFINLAISASIIKLYSNTNA